MASLEAYRLPPQAQQGLALSWGLEAVIFLGNIIYGLLAAGEGQTLPQ